MKKQILILAFLLVAIFAGVTNSYGQLLPRAMTCLTSDALHPIAGQLYTYAIDVPVLPAGAKTYNWLVTQDANFIATGNLTSAIQTTAGSLLFATGTGYNAPGTTAVPGTGTSSVTLTWKSFVYNPLAPVFVVVQVIGLTTGTGACETSNLKVFKIVPVNAFTLDIANRIAAGTNLDEAGALADATYGNEIFKCIHNIVSATFDPTSGAEGVIYNYGTDYLLFEVVAANFNASWRPTVQLTNIDAEETVKVEWSKDPTFATGVIIMAGSAVGTGIVPTIYTTPSGSDVTATVVGGAVGASGESIYIRVTLDHSVGTLNFEGLAAEPITLAVDGLTNLSAALPADYIGDVHHANGQLSAGPPVVCNAPAVDAYTNDIAHQTINARPTIAAVAATPTPGFLPVKP